MTTLKQLRDAASLEGINKISEIAMSGECNASDTLIEKGCVKGNSWGGPFDHHPEFVGYWIGSIRSLLSSDTHSDEVVEYFASIGVSA
jgi:hypothetical protein